MLRSGSAIARTLHDIHKLRVLHRSVKPENIAFGVSGSNDVFLLDFGMAALGLRDAAGALFALPAIHICPCMLDWQGILLGLRGT